MTESTCTIPECDKPTKGRGWCAKHYTRWSRYGSPTARMPGEVVDGKRVCPGCHADKLLAEYTPNTTGRCKRCLAAAARSRYTPVEKVDLPPIYCLQCGGKFVPRSTRVMMCSAECARSRKRALDAVQQGNNRERANVSSRAWTERNKAKVADNSRRYRARKVGAVVEHFSRLSVFERDNWVCGICKRPVNKNASFPAWDSPSLDHVIPLSRGGEHSMTNSQTAHLRCNLSKGDRMVA